MFHERRSIRRNAFTLVALLVMIARHTSGNPFNWWYVSHARRANSAGVQFTEIPPAGMHCVTLDGSARWYAYHSDPQRSEMEVVIRVPGVSDPGFFWGKPAR